MKGLKIFVGIMGLCVTMPIWFFLVYTMLSAIHPDRLTWFLFCIYLPAWAVVGIVQMIIVAYEKSEKD